MVDYEIIDVVESNEGSLAIASAIATNAVNALHNQPIKGYTESQINALSTVFTPEIIHQRIVGNPLILARDARTIVGSQLVDTSQEPHELKLLYIDPAHQGRGIGSTLLDMGIQHAISRGQKMVFGETFDNDVSLPFYIGRGWQRCEQVRYDVGEEEITLRRIEKVLS